MVRNRNFLVIAQKAKTALQLGKIQAIQNSYQEKRKWDRRVDKKPFNLVE